VTRRATAATLPLVAALLGCPLLEQPEDRVPRPGSGEGTSARPSGGAASGDDPFDPPEERPVAPAGEPVTGGGAAGAEEAEEAEEEAQEPERDLSAELRALVGDPVSCMDDVDPSELPERISVRVRAHVSTRGVVTRVTVSGTGLTGAARDCLSGRLSTARMRAPVPDAPRAVSTEIVVERRPVEEP